MTEPRQTTILLVDDDADFLPSLAAGLSELKGRQFLMAPNGKRAVEILESTPVDLVVTDLKMPELSGFDLVAWLGRYRPEVPAIVMTAFGGPVMQAEFDALGVAGFVEKPIDVANLAFTIETVLAGPGGAARRDGGRVFPPGAEGLLAALREAADGGLDGEVVVRNGQESGRVFFCGGRVGWTVASGLRQTFMALLTERTAVGVDELRGVYEECRRSGRNFAQTLVEWGLLDGGTVSQLLLEHVARGVAALLAWERSDVLFVPERRSCTSAQLFGLDEVLQTARALHGEVRLRTLAQSVMPRPEPRRPPSSPALPAIAADPLPPQSDTQGETDMQSQKITEVLETLRGIDGFIGAATFTSSGETIAQASNTGMHLDELGALANDVLLKAQKTTDIMGVGRGNQIHVAAPKANILVRCLNENTDFAANEPGRAHIHMMLILSPEGNLALGRMQLEKAIQAVAPIVR